MAEITSTSPQRDMDTAAREIPAPAGIGAQLNNEKDSIIAGKYAVGKALGEGTYGKVRLGTNLRTGEQIAIKCIQKSSLRTQRQFNRIKREIYALKVLRHHPNIVNLIEVLEDDQHIVLILEYCSGGEVFDYIVAHCFVKESEARKFFRQILSAVDYCHKNKIVHRDLKPENLLLDSDKNIKLVDFGFSNSFRDQSHLDTFCGSPFYAAPEMVNGRRYFGPEVDVWSLGVILYALLCGCLPFDDSNVKILYQKISSGVYKVPPHLSRQARALVRRMLTVDPSKRCTIDELMNHPWVNEGYDEIPLRVNVRPDQLQQLDQQAIDILISYGYKRSNIEGSLAQLHGYDPEVRKLYLQIIDNKDDVSRIPALRRISHGKQDHIIPSTEQEWNPPQRPHSVHTEALQQQRMRKQKQKADRQQMQSMHVHLPETETGTHGLAWVDPRIERAEHSDLPVLVAHPEEDSEEEEEIEQNNGHAAAVAAVAAAAGISSTATKPTTDKDEMASAPNLDLQHSVHRQNALSGPVGPPVVIPSGATEPLPEQESPDSEEIQREKEAMDVDRETPVAEPPLRHVHGKPIPGVLVDTPETLTPDVDEAGAQQVAGAVETETASLDAEKESKASRRNSLIGKFNLGQAFSALKIFGRKSRGRRTSSSEHEEEVFVTGDAHKLMGESDEEVEGLPTPTDASKVGPASTSGEPGDKNPVLTGVAQAERLDESIFSTPKPKPTAPEVVGVAQTTAAASTGGALGHAAADTGRPDQKVTRVRNITGRFNVGTTSSKPPEAICREVERVLKQYAQSYERDGCVFTTTAGFDGSFATISIEVCHIPRLNLYGLHCGRISGDSWGYKKILNHLLDKMVL
eukprot:Clim_evm24s237 gene=Clim_evmTU24s237